MGVVAPSMGIGLKACMNAAQQISPPASAVFQYANGMLLHVAYQSWLTLHLH